MSKGQDYIARIRFQNELPPPLLPPKLLKFQVPEKEAIGSELLLTNLYRKQNIQHLIQVDNDLGMGIEAVSSLPELFEGTEPKERPHVDLHPHDTILLRDPGIERTVKNEPNVAFLRRTEYIAGISKSGTGAAMSRGATPSTNDKGKNATENDTPEGLLHAVEATFESATKTLNDLSSLRHPLKKQMKAKKVWSLLPDVSRLDQVFSTVRATNLDNEGDNALENGLFREVKIPGSNVGQVSAYVLGDISDLSQLRERLNKLDENDTGRDDEERFKFLKQGDFELRSQRMDNTPLSNSVNDNNIKEFLNTNDDEIREIALKFDTDNGVVYYNVIQAKSEVKKRKLKDADREAFDELDLDELNLKIREPTVQELNIRNNKRHKFDDINYESIEIEKVEEDEEDDLGELMQ